MKLDEHAEPPHPCPGGCGDAVAWFRVHCGAARCIDRMRGRPHDPLKHHELVLRQEKSASTVHPVGESDAIRDLEARVHVMRRLGVTKWGDIELGPEPQPEAKVETQSKSPEDRERKARNEQRRIALSASGRLVPRLGEDRIE